MYNKCGYTSYFDRPITYTDESKKEIFLNKVMEKDDTLAIEPHKYRHPEKIR